MFVTNKLSQKFLNLHIWHKKTNDIVVTSLTSDAVFYGNTKLVTNNRC